LYGVYYEQKSGPSCNRHQEAVLRLAESSVDLAFDDTTLDDVEDVWKVVMGLTGGDQVSSDLVGTYMKFEDRVHMTEEEDYDGA
jgi:hypothetical protein